MLLTGSQYAKLVTSLLPLLVRPELPKLVRSELPKLVRPEALLRRTRLVTRTLSLKEKAPLR